MEANLQQPAPQPQRIQQNNHHCPDRPAAELINAEWEAYKNTCLVLLL
jgi:hypothetical protein